MGKLNLKCALFLFVLYGCVNNAFTQQIPQFSQFVFNNYLVNPAACGISDNMKVNLGYRTQWVGFDSAPKTYFISGHTPISSKNREPRSRNNHHGVGGYIAADETGPISQINLNGSYAYHMRVSYNLWASVGFFAGFKQYKLDPTTLYTASPNDVDLVPVNSIVPDITIGVWMYNKEFFGGFSMKQVMPIELKPSESKLEKHYALSGGYRFHFKRTNSDLIYALNLKMGTVTPMQMDFSVKYNYRQIGWLGFSYRKVDAIIGMIGVNLSKYLEVGYAYDITLSKIKGYSSNTHEIIIGLKFMPTRKRNEIKCPMWG